MTEPSAQAAPPTHFARSFWHYGLAMVLVVGAWTGWNAYLEYQSVMAQEYRLLELHARQREARIAGALRSVDLALRSIASDLREHPDLSTPRMNQLLRDALRQLPEVRNILVEDATGIIVGEAKETSIGANASGRDYFKHHLGAPGDDSPYIARPFLAFKGPLVTVLSRVRRDGKGQFAGVVVASIDASFFEEALQFFTPGPGMEASLVNHEGDILSRAPMSDHVGQSLHGGTAFTEHMQSGQATTRHLARAKLDSVLKMSVFHEVRGSTLVVIVSREFDTVLTEWRQSLVLNLAAFVLLGSTTLLFSWMAARHQRSLAQAHERIEAQELHLRTIIEAEPECVKQLALDGTLLQMNRAGLLMVEADSPNQVVGHSIKDLIAPQYHDTFMAMLLRVFAGHTDSLTFEVRGLKGGRRWLDTQAVPLRDPQGRITACLGVARDVSARRELEAALQESESFVVSVIDSLPEHIVVIDMQGSITAVNESWRRFAEVHGAASPIRHWNGANYLKVCGHAPGLPTGDKVPPALAGIQAVLAGDQPYFAMEYPDHTTREPRWFNLKALPLRARNSGAVLIHQNITERHLARQRLKASEERYRLLAENISDVIWVLDLPDGRFSFISPSVRQLCGYSVDEVMAMSMEATLTPESAARSAAHMHEMLTRIAAGDHANLTQTYEVDQPHRDGHVVRTEVVTHYLLDESGVPTSILGVSRDISERKQHEAQRDESRRQLEQKLADISELQARLKEQALRDPLTGLFNRRFIDESLPIELARAKREGQPLTLVMLDLDHFKQVNDTYGHAVGDEVLKFLAAMLMRGARASDIVCRYGGEEFLIALPRMSRAQAVQRVESWRQELHDAVIHHGEFALQVTLSAGVAGFPHDGADVSTLVNCADTALYRSKHGGRDRVSCYCSLP